MNKIYLTLSVLLIGIFARAQDLTLPLDSTTKKVSYSEVVNVSKTKNQLFDNTLEWFAVYFKSSNDVIQIKDKESGKFVAKFFIPNVNNIPPTSVSILIFLKENKYKYIFNDVIYVGGSGTKSWGLEENPTIWQAGLTKSGIKSIKSTANTSILNAIESLKNYLAKKDESNF